MLQDVAGELYSFKVLCIFEVCVRGAKGSDSFHHSPSHPATKPPLVLLHINMSQLLNDAAPLISFADEKTSVIGQFPCDLIIILFTLVNVPGHLVSISLYHRATLSGNEKICFHRVEEARISKKTLMG